MRLLFAKQQEEVRILKRSVTVFQIETGSRLLATDGPHAIALQTEAPRADRVSATIPSSGFSRQRKEPAVALGTRANQTDCVDLRRGPTGEGPVGVTYGPTIARRGIPLTEGSAEKGVARTYNKGVPLQGRLQAGERDDSWRRIDGGRPALSDLRVCKFMAVQKMTEDRSHPTKRTMIDIEV